MKKKSNVLLSVLVLLALLIAGRLGLAPKDNDAARPIATSAHTAVSDVYDASETDVPDEDAVYTDRAHVAAYLNAYGRLPDNYITKKEAQQLGLGNGRTLDEVAPGMSIGGDHFGNYENKLPDASGRSWRECDIDYVRGNRNAKRIVYSSDGLIYYTNDHYETFERLY